MQCSLPKLQLGALLLSLCVFSSFSYIRFASRPFQNHFQRGLEAQNNDASTDSWTSTTIPIKLISFNILAPCYNKIKVGNSNTYEFESSFPEKYLERNKLICQQLIDTKADVICLQEFWSGNEELKNLFREKLCNKAGYTMKELRRTSHWRTRDDGLAVFINENRVVLQDSKDILFHDCGDRVAQMLLLAVRPPVSTNITTLSAYKQFICVNTHLLFPHNQYSTSIRLREMTKILGFIESYRQRDLCTDICGRADVRLPVVITGDFNGSPNGSVYKYIRSQNFRSAFEEINESMPSKDTKLSDLQLHHDNTNYNHDKPVCITHKSHRESVVNVDHVFYLNPSEQTEEQLPPLPDWTNLVFRELMQRILDQRADITMGEIFSTFDEDNSSFVSHEEFRAALGRLGFAGEGLSALTNDEVEILLDSADKNGDGVIDYKEFYSRFWLAANNLEQSNDYGSIKNSESARSTWLTNTDNDFKAGNLQDSMAISDPKSTNTNKNMISQSARSFENIVVTKVIPNYVPMGDLSIKSFKLSPNELMSGTWPADYSLSDHGMVECVLECDV